MRNDMEIGQGARLDDSRKTKEEVLRFHAEHRSHVRRTRALWVIVILLIGGLAGLSWYGAPLLQEHQGMLGKMPALQSGLTNVSARMSSTEQQLSAWANDRMGFSDRMSKVEQSLKAARNEARTVAAQVKRDMAQNLQALQTNMAQSLQALQNQVRGVESIQREHAEEVARLRSEMSGVQVQLAAMREENTIQKSQLRQLEQAHQSTRDDLSGVDRRVSSNKSAIGALASQVERQRVPFELPTGRTQQVADGIYVTINHANVERQQIDGWIQIKSDGRIVWMRGENAQKPITFASRSDSRPYQLVFTSVGKDDSAGYLLVPMASSAAPATTAGND